MDGAFAISGSSEDITLRVGWLTTSMEYGNTLAAQQLAHIYRRGLGRLEKGEKQAFGLMKWSAEQSLLPAHSMPTCISNTPLELGTWYYHGICIPKDYREALKWFTIASNQPNSNGQSEYNICLIYAW
jgi:TPR repeat protein